MSGEADWPWSELGITQPVTDEREVRRAYARRLKTIDQARDAAAFSALREAYEVALDLLQTEAPATPQCSSDVDHGTQNADAETPPPDHRLDALLALIREPDPSRRRADRVTEALSDPMTQDAAVLEILGAEIAAQIVASTKYDHRGNQLLARDWTAPLIDLLDQRFRWLSDYAAYDRDFGSDANLMQAMWDRVAILRVPSDQGPASIPSQSGHGHLRPLAVLGFMLVATGLNEATRGTAAEPVVGDTFALGIAGLATWFLTRALYGFWTWRFGQLTSGLLTLACVATAALGLLRLSEVWPPAGPLAAGLATATLMAALVLALSSRLALLTEAVLNRLRDRMGRSNAQR